MTIAYARDYFFHLHDVEVNQKYNGNLPYSFHLEMAEKQAKKFIHLITSHQDHILIYCGIYGHDSIEDARLSYNNIKDIFGEEVAEIIYLCTENKGRNRDERKSKQFYKELAENKLAVFVKLCDLIANVKFSLLTNSSMFDKYKKEYQIKTRRFLWCIEYQEMFLYLDQIFKI